MDVAPGRAKRLGLRLSFLPLCLPRDLASDTFNRTAWPGACLCLPQPITYSLHAPSSPAQRTLEAVWQKAHLHWIRSVFAGAECDAAVLPIGAGSTAYGTSSRRQRLHGAGIHLRSNRRPVHG